MKNCSLIVAAAVVLVGFPPSQAIAERQMERLGRGVVAIHQGEGEVFVGWRLLGTDPEEIAFNLYRSSGDSDSMKINDEPITSSTTFLDHGVDLSRPVTYSVHPLLGGKEGEASGRFTLAANAPARPYLSVPLQTPDGYRPNDASVGDLDGDGEYDIVVHQVGRGRDNSQRGTTTEPILEAYKLDGTMLWRINLGKNIREGAHYTQFMVYDLDGDGKAEVACKTADGTVDGKGKVIGDGNADHRNRDGYILKGPEFLTVFDGQTGAALATADYIPPRGVVAKWGDSRGNRVDRFLACIAYLDGRRPSLVMCRGYYTRAVLAAWNWRDGKLTHVWTFDSDDGTPGNRAYRGQGNHGIGAGDVDGDGRDEIVYGSCVIDDNGKGLYSTGLGHGDAMHFSDLDPERPGLEIFKANGDGPNRAGIQLRDAGTGKQIWGVRSTGRGGVGRAVALDIDPRHAGYEMWGRGRGVEGLYSAKGKRLANDSPRPCNMGAWWDGDLLREMLDAVTISKWDYEKGETKPLLDAGSYDCRRNNGSKANPCLCADILGDWREEVIWRTRDRSELRIFTTTIPTEHRIYTLMHDPIYRLSVAWQNVSYNQPAHPGFFLGHGMAAPPRPSILTTPTKPQKRAEASDGKPDLKKPARTESSFDHDWRFQKGDAAGAEKPAFDATGWRSLNLPHDWSIEGPFDENHPTGRGGGYLPSGVSWYRKRFTLGEEDARRRVFVDFDGVMAHSDVWINGVHLGERPFGYVSFRYELTDHLRFGPEKPNLIAVRTDTTAQPASRWYTGQGIYRHVRLVVTDPLHIDHWGVYVTTPSVAPERAVVRVETRVVNQSTAEREVTLRTTLLDPDGREATSAPEATQSVPAGGAVDFSQEIVVTNPQIWDLDEPNLYRAVSRLHSGGEVIDNEVNTFGIREFKFEADTGFWLNGKNLKLKGVCLHHAAGGHGAAVPLSAWERRLRNLKRVGVNAIRVGHAPMAPEFYDLCDRMGFCLLNEVLDTWTARKRHGDHGYNRYFKEWWKADTRDIVLRDRNHPSIILYSAGNEIRDNLNNEEGFATFKAMRDLIHRHQPTVPVTMALFRPNQARVYDNGFAELMDVVGQNYREQELVRAHLDRPERKVIGTENSHSLQAWRVLRDHPFMAGQFLWTGIDYRGEADWPRVIATSGLLDSTGELRPRGYQRQSWWSEEPMVHIVRSETPEPGQRRSRRRRAQLFSNWTPRDAATYEAAEVEVYSNTEEVELFLNGKSIGSKPRPADDRPRRWSFPFEAGTLKALGKNGGEVVATHELHSAGKPAKILLAADRDAVALERDDVAYVRAVVADQNGTRCPWADDLVTFKLTGPAAIVAVDSADPTYHGSYRGSKRRAFEGRCLAILAATAPSGRITLKASAPGLEPAEVSLDRDSPQRNTEAHRDVEY